MSGKTAQSRRVLLIGAHLDGTWVELPEHEHAYRVAKPFRIDVAAWAKQVEQHDVGIPLPDVVEYRIERIPIAINTASAVVWIGVASGLFGLELDRAVVRALFQRDVAQLFREAP
ncbi:hypothetical protein [Streptomyces sp. NPDC050704]|uniref:hypothetical protein n=1 Tax=Streptomyces sp. NPDC050704 TaxID=3157219 RepID=UPI0034184D43